MKHNKIWSVIFLISMLALAGCPDMAQKGGESSQSGSSGRSGGGGE